MLRMGCCLLCTRISRVIRSSNSNTHTRGVINVSDHCGTFSSLVFTGIYTSISLDKHAGDSRDLAQRRVLMIIERACMTLNGEAAA